MVEVLQEPSGCTLLPGGQHTRTTAPLSGMVCAPHGQHTPEVGTPAASVKVEQVSLQQPVTLVGSEAKSRQVSLQQALACVASGSTGWQLPGGQQSLTAGLARLGHIELGGLQQVPSVMQMELAAEQQVFTPVVLTQTWLLGQHWSLTHVVSGRQQLFPQTPSLGQQMVTLAPLNRAGRQDVLQQNLLVTGPVLGMSRLGHTWPLGQHTLSWLLLGVVKEGSRKLLQLSQQARLVGSEPGHTGHTVWLAWGQHPTLESRQASFGQHATVPFDKLHV